MSVVKLQDIIGVKKKKIEPLDEIEIISNITADIVGKLVNYSGLTKTELINVLPVSARTIGRLSDSKIKNMALAEHLLCLAKVTAEGLEVFENSRLLANWLKKPHAKLSGIEPYELLETVYGCNIVINILGQIKYGNIG